jgi:PPOX class probable F420-dependent enzyme
VEWVLTTLAAAPVGRMATTSAGGGVRLVPVCFALLPDRVVSAVDHKPKRSPRLSRLDDMRATGRAVLLVDHYEDDWTQLWWIRVTGAATVHDHEDPLDEVARAALAAKYHQYREHPPAGPVWSIGLDELRWWTASPTPGSGPS